MANKKNWLGKVQKDVGGYKIRQMATSRIMKSAGGRDTTHIQPTGKYGVYAGRKKLIKGDFVSVADAEAYAVTL